MKTDIVLIAGPTASGKSAAALALAEAIGGAVINADSMQIYRELRILTARPSDADEARVPHRLFGHVSVRELYSVARYQSDAANALAEVRASGLTPIFVGGTGLYFAALTEGIADIPPVPAQVREQTRARLEAIGSDAFHAELGARDAEMAHTLRASDRQRMLRAYEVIEATGRSLSHWQRAAGRPVVGALRVAKFVLDVPRPVLRARIEVRFRDMLARGAVTEAIALADLDPKLPATKILGVRELIAAQNGQMSEEKAVERAITLTRQYAKRQMTWFRHRTADWHWIKASERNFVAEMLEEVA